MLLTVIEFKTCKFDVNYLNYALGRYYYIMLFEDIVILCYQVYLLNGSQIVGGVYSVQCVHNIDCTNCLLAATILFY